MRRQPFYHLTHDGREVILEGIINNTALIDIAASIGMHPTSISREVKRHRISSGRGTTMWTNICAHFKGCTISKLCRDNCRKPTCSRCLSRRCFDLCSNFEEIVCKRTSRWPYVCNGCDKNRHCGFERFYYRPAVAEATADRVKRESRSAITLGKEELLTLDELIVPLLKDNKQSPEAICSNNPEAISISPQTLRRYINDGHVRSIRLDLLSAPARKVRRQARPKTSKHQEDGRSYADFLALPEEVQEHTWEMDTVFGSRSDKGCLLTLVNRKNLLLLPFKMWRPDSENVVGMLDYLEVLCEDAGASFEELFPVILTDNGTEMSDSEGIEQSCLLGAKRTRLYYCDPYSSWQKPYIEGRHTLLRRISPKGEPLDPITHAQIASAASHINSYPSASREGETPFDMAHTTIPGKIFEELGIKKIGGNEVALTRNLFYR